MKYLKISDRLTIAGQPNKETIAQLKKEGFNALINLRPDAENNSLNHLDDAEIAHQSGLEYHYIPLSINDLTLGDIRAFQKLIRNTDYNYFVHCHSGTRAFNLYVISEVLDGHIREEDIDAIGRNHGVSLEAAKTWLQKQNKHQPIVEGFFEPRTWSVQYIVIDPSTKKCAIIDPVLDYDEKSGSVKTTEADKLLAYIKKHDLHLEWILDTHPHADHFTAASYLKEKTKAPIAIGAHVKDVQTLWKKLYNMPEMKTDGSQWDRLFEAGDTFKVGNLDGRILFSPGHTLASITYVIGDAAFVHDTIFMPDSGTARADFPGGSAAILWNSIEEILSLPEQTRIFTGHDYQPHGRHPRWESTVKIQKETNPHLANMTKEKFIQIREARDKTLPMPKLILHALQINTQAGRLPKAENNGTSYLKLPLNILDNPAW